MYEHIPAYAGDPILSLNQDFLADTRPAKVNLSIGVYTDEQGSIPVLGSVAAAAERLARQAAASAYLPMAGSAEYRSATQALVFGERNCVTARLATVQTVGGSGALRLAAEFIRDFLPGTCVALSDPSWDNHEVVMRSADLQVRRFPWFDRRSRGLDLQGMLQAWRELPARSVVLLQPCCHNPTGIDPSPGQWAEMIALLRERELVPLVDMAYQGFGDGVEEDVSPLRAMVEAGLLPLVATSYSKNFSLYGERCGSLTMVCPDAAQAERVLGQLQAGIRKLYSSPPRHGATLIATVLGDEALRAQWQAELEDMRRRMLQMRRELADAIRAREPAADTAFLTQQRGMFSFTGLTPGQVDAMRERDAIYLIRSGRLCVAGLTRKNVDCVAEVLAPLLLS